MSEIKIVDPWGLEHHEREALIFQSIEELKKEKIGANIKPKIEAICFSLFV